MTVYYVRDEEVDEEGYRVDAYDVECAAVEACEHWYRHSRWSGSPPPEMSLEVRQEDSEEWVRVDVETSWQVHFRGLVVTR